MNEKKNEKKSDFSRVAGTNFNSVFSFKAIVEARTSQESVVRAIAASESKSQVNNQVVRS